MGERSWLAGEEMKGTAVEEIFDAVLGFDAEGFLRAAEEQAVDIVCMSALLTTTMPAMAATVRLLAERRPRTRTMVGGAPVTRAFAERIGATATAPTPRGRWRRPAGYGRLVGRICAVTGSKKTAGRKDPAWNSGCVPPRASIPEFLNDGQEDGFMEKAELYEALKNTLVELDEQQVLNLTREALDQGRIPWRSSTGVSCRGSMPSAGFSRRRRFSSRS